MSQNEHAEPHSRGTHLRLVPNRPAPATAPPHAPSTARERIEIIPLPAAPTRPAPLVPARADADPPLAPVMATAAGVDRRRPEGDASRPDALARLHCRACGMRARIDLVDLSTRRVHLSCDRCYRMWQEQIRAGDPARLSQRR